MASGEGVAWGVGPLEVDVGSVAADSTATSPASAAREDNRLAFRHRDSIKVTRKHLETVGLGGEPTVGEPPRHPPRLLKHMDSLAVMHAHGVGEAVPRVRRARDSPPPIVGGGEDDEEDEEGDEDEEEDEANPGQLDEGSLSEGSAEAAGVDDTVGPVDAVVGSALYNSGTRLTRFAPPSLRLTTGNEADGTLAVQNKSRLRSLANGTLSFLGLRTSRKTRGGADGPDSASPVTVTSAGEGGLTHLPSAVGFRPDGASTAGGSSVSSSTASPVGVSAASFTAGSPRSILKSPDRPGSHAPHAVHHVQLPAVRLSVASEMQRRRISFADNRGGSLAAVHYVEDLHYSEYADHTQEAGDKACCIV